MRFRTRQLLAWAGLAIAVGAAGASAQGVRALDAGGGLYLHQVGSRVALREPSGRVSELSLPPGTSLRRLVPLAGGWLVAGEVEAGGLSELLLQRAEDGVQSPVPAPPNEAGDALRGGPMPLVERGRLVGLAWLSGARVRQTAVWASRWSGRGWSPPELVSPVGPGTQIAIDGAVLADGSWLLVWSAHDGGDDEIVWSRWTAAGWSAPAPLHEPNEVPDIKPSLAAVGSGALAAWGWWDGGTYRVRLAAFEAGAWRELDFPSPAGAVDPGLTPSGDGARLLYRVVTPSAWVLHELDRRGGTLRAATLETASTLRPGLASGEGSIPALEWPGEEIAAPRRVELEWRAEP